MQTNLMATPVECCLDTRENVNGLVLLVLLRFELHYYYYSNCTTTTFSVIIAIHNPYRCANADKLDGQPLGVLLKYAARPPPTP